MLRLASPACAIAALLLFGAPAAAQVKICNEFVATIHVAFARQDHNGYTAVGWWNVPKGVCQTTTYTLQGGDTLHYAADSDGYRSAGGTRRDHWGNAVKLFVGSKDFNYTNAEKSRSGAKAEMFGTFTAPAKPAIEPPPVAATLHFKPGGTSVDFTEAGGRNGSFDQLPDVDPPDRPFDTKRL
jgi:uncharacterized membrane protein